MDPQVAQKDELSSELAPLKSSQEQQQQNQPEQHGNQVKIQLDDHDEDNELAKLMSKEEEEEEAQGENKPHDKSNDEHHCESPKEQNGSRNENSHPKKPSDAKLSYTSDDYKNKLLSLVGGNTVYNDCTIPYDIKASRDRFFGGRSVTPNGFLGGYDVDLNDPNETKINIKSDVEDEDEAAKIKLTNGNTGANGTGKSSVSGDVIQSINNLRQNVNNQIIGGSKNVMCRMRKLSMSELGKNGKSANRKYRLAFYGTLALLSLLFLYLIYQNLFNDR